jgi:hypothetical protein
VRRQNPKTLKIGECYVRALKLSRFKNVLTLKSKTLKENVRALKLSWLGNFRALNLFILVRINQRKENII